MEGGLIVAPIHLSSLDPPALAVTLKKRRLRALAKEELWNNKLFGAIIEGIGAFPLKRGAGDRESIKKCISLLQGGEAVIIFPEGSRGDGSMMLPMQQGVAMIAKNAGVPVLPAGICGTHKGGKGRVTVVYGDPFTYAEVQALASNEKEARRMFLERIEKAIQSLCAEAGLNLTTSPSMKDRPELTDPAESPATRAGEPA
jgi:1-acyl-sn-glycerol-3-phosphate acyltransferase